MRRFLVLVITLALLAQGNTQVSRAGEPPGLDRVAELGPAAALRWVGNRVVPRLDKVPEAAAKIVTEAARTLNEAASEGYLTVSRQFDVAITQAGSDYIAQQVNELSAGCIQAGEITADWLGFHATLTTTCSDERIEELFGDDPAAAQPVSAAGFGVLPAEQPQAAAIPIISEDMDCLLNIIGLAFTAIGFLLLMAIPPAGWLLWASWAVAGGAAILQWISFVVNCTGILAAKQRVRNGTYVVDYNCYVILYSNYRWSHYAQKWVPTYVRYGC